MQPDDRTEVVRRRRRTWIRDALIMLVVLLAVGWWQTRDLLGSGAPAPDAQLAVLSGGRSALIAAGDKPQILYFFAPWCGVCKVTAHNIRALAADRDYHVTAVALSYDTPGSVTDFVLDHDLGNATVLLGTPGMASAYQVASFPTFYIVKNRTITARSVGYTTELGLRARSWF